MTVLAYHRIVDDRSPDFRGLAANVSATPENFGVQLDVLARWFNVISLDLLLEWLGGRVTLPRYPALITFDDGYRDIFDHALPALRQRDLPAVLFLATGCVGNSTPFFWDLAAHCFQKTRKTEADLPLCGRQQWPDESARQRVLDTWLGEAKQRSIGEINKIVSRLREVLDVEVPADTFVGQHVSWSQVCELHRSNVAIAAHTQSHSILSRISSKQAREQVVRSKCDIEAKLGVSVQAFAYPNGSAKDYRADDVEMLRSEGFAAAFTLLDGPMSPRAMRRNPLEIRRILITRNDDLASFTAKITGVTGLIRRFRGG